MKNILLGAALAIGLGVVPALAADKTEHKSGDARTDTMFESEDGSLQGKPVVDGPADWSHLRPESASTGESSGTSGDDTSPGAAKSPATK